MRFTEISEPERRTTISKISIVFCASCKLGSADIDVVALLLDPVIVSPAVKEPLGTVIVSVVLLGFVMIFAVEELLDPVIVSPTDKLAEAPTVAVIVPIGYTSIAEVLESWATVCENCRTVHKLIPRLAQSANIRLSDLRAVVAS